MATTKPKAPTFKADAVYSVQLTRPVTVPGGELLPIHTHRIKGSVLDGIEPDAIGSATELPPSPFANL